MPNFGSTRRRKDFEARLLAARDEREKNQNAVSAARKRLEELERESRRLSPHDIPPIIREKVQRELQQAQQEYERLDFFWNDAAPSHQARLAAVNAAHREFWRQGK